MPPKKCHVSTTQKSQPILELDLNLGTPQMFLPKMRDDLERICETQECWAIYWQEKAQGSATLKSIEVKRWNASCP